MTPCRIACIPLMRPPSPVPCDSTFPGRRLRHKCSAEIPAASREARHGQVEAAPEKMNGAHFADKGGAELLKNCVYEHQNPPEPVDILRIVRGMLHVLIERNRVRNFHRHLPDLHLNTKLA